MEQKKYMVMIVLGVILLLFIAGCKCEVEKEKPDEESPFIGGTEGLRIKFVPFSPPEEITDSGDLPFKAIVNLRNWGEYDLSGDDVKVSLVGFLPSEFGVSSDDEEDLYDRNPTALTGRKRDSQGNIIEPPESLVVFPSAQTNFNFEGDIAGDTLYPFRAKVCYEYQTKVQSRICVLKNLINPAYNPICEPSGEKQVFSSCSPVTVSAFRQSVVGKDQIQFSFDIEHVGTGHVFEGTADGPDCPEDSPDRYVKENKVKVTVDTGIKVNLRCESEEDTDGSVSLDVNLVNGKRTVTCVQTLDEGRQYEANQLVKVFLDFNYFDDNTEQRVLVKHVSS